MLRTGSRRIACMVLAFAAVAASAPSALAERWPGTTASIGGAIAARVIGVKCKDHLKPDEIVELDTYIERRQQAFMAKSAANTRLAETAFPRIARDYDFMYSQPDACSDSSRIMARDMLDRVRSVDAKPMDKQAGLAR